MRKFYRFFSRGIIVWVIAVILAANIKSERVDWLMVTVVGGTAILLGSYLIFVFLWMFFLRNKEGQVLSSDPIPADKQIYVMAQMTGNTNEVTFSHRGQGLCEYTEYEITYTVNGRQFRKWFHMYPGPNLGDIYEGGCPVQILCDRDKPEHFEVLKIGAEKE